MRTVPRHYQFKFHSVEWPSLIFTVPCYKDGMLAFCCPSIEVHLHSFGNLINNMLPWAMCTNRRNEVDTILLQKTMLGRYLQAVLCFKACEIALCCVINCELCWTGIDVAFIHHLSNSKCHKNIMFYVYCYVNLGAMHNS